MQRVHGKQCSFQDMWLTTLTTRKTQPFIEKFGPLTFGGEARLQKLVIKELAIKPTLQKLRDGLGKPGGIFTVINPGLCTAEQ